MRIDVCSLNLLCSNKDVLYRLCFRRRQNSVTLENLWRRFVCARLYCRKCTLSFFFSSKCAVLGDSLEVLQKCWGLFPHPCPKEDIQEVSDDRLALILLQCSFTLSALGAWGDFKNSNSKKNWHDLESHRLTLLDPPPMFWKCHVEQQHAIMQISRFESKVFYFLRKCYWPSLVCTSVFHSSFFLFLH